MEQTWADRIEYGVKVDVNVSERPVVTFQDSAVDVQAEPAKLTAATVRVLQWAGELPEDTDAAEVAFGSVMSLVVPATGKFQSNVLQWCYQEQTMWKTVCMADAVRIGRAIALSQFRQAGMPATLRARTHNAPICECTHVHTYA